MVAAVPREGTAAPGVLGAARVPVLLAAFAVCVALRVAVGGVGVSQSPSAGLVFAGCLMLLARAAGTRTVVSGRALLTGLGGGVLICAPVAVGQVMALRPLHEIDGFWRWALVVSVVAAAEEAFLRGALYDAISDLAGAGPAIGVGALAFALLHVPLYGWHVVPLDLAVGLVLGGLRASTGTWTATALAHVSADLVGWFLR